MTEPSIKLSQCMIVKNEEKNIEKALSWGRDIVCEQIVVDTGSADRTIELAERAGARVYHFKWIDDFSAAKNYAIEQASGDWIAFLDADEYFTEESVERLPALLEKLSDDRIKMIVAKELHTGGDGNVIGVATQVRLFRNDSRIRYRNRIHETLVWEGEQDWVKYDAQDMLMIIHTGYSHQTMNPEKGLRNAGLLEQDLKERPDDILLQMYLGDAYNMAQKREESLRCYRKVIRDGRPDSDTERVAFLRSGLQLCSILFGQYGKKESRDEIREVIESLKASGERQHPDIDFFSGICCMGEEQIQKAAELFESALDKLDKYHGMEMCRITSMTDMVNGTIAAGAFMANDLQKAVNYSVAALRVNKYHADGIRILLKCFMTEYNEGMPAEPYWQFLCKIYDINNLKDILFIYKFSKEAGFDGLADMAYGALPEEVKNEGLIR